jgi:hypothetical protein
MTVGAVDELGPTVQGLVARASDPQRGRWLEQVRRTGACRHPVRLRGVVLRGDERLNSTAGEPDGALMVRCGNRREACCPSCAYEYRGDMWQLVYAGLAGGRKGVPDSVAGHPQVFATLTAPSFGPVHSRPEPGWVSRRPGFRSVCAGKRPIRRRRPRLPDHDRDLWRDHDWRNWRWRIFDPLAATAGAPGMRPYDLRHAFCSLLIAEGLSVVEVARQAGHAPTMTLDTYAHVMADHDGAERLSAEAAIRAARDAEVSACAPGPVPYWPNPQCLRRALHRTRTDDPFLTMEFGA